MKTDLIIQLLLSATEENTALAELLASGQGWNVTDILQQYGYADIGIRELGQLLNPVWLLSARKIKKLPPLPASLRYAVSVVVLSFSHNQLTKIPALRGKNLRRLNFNNNQIEQIAPLKLANLTRLYCAGNRLRVLPKLSDTKLLELDCRHNQLQALREDMPSSLRYLLVENNPIQ